MVKTKIYLVSGNQQKANFIKNYFQTDLDDSVKFKTVGVRSSVSRKPVGKEVFKGAYEKTASIADMRYKDYVIGFEGGYFKMNGSYFIGEVCCVRHKDKYHFGLSPFVKISKNMFECVKNDIPLGLLVSEYMGVKHEDFKEKSGVLQYLTNGKFSRSVGSVVAFNDAMKAEGYPSFEEVKFTFKCQVVKNNTYAYNILDAMAKAHLTFLNSMKDN